MARLHIAAAGFPGELPVLAPLRAQISDALAALERQRVLEPGVLTALRDRHAEILAGLDGIGGPKLVLHGDAHPGNLLWSPAGWLWTDLEETCRGPRAFDLAVLVRGQDAADAATALAAYADVTGDPLPEPGELAWFDWARALEGAVWTAAMAHQYPARYAERAPGVLARRPGGQAAVARSGPWAHYGGMKARSSRYAVPGPRGSQVATVLASLARDPLGGYVRLAARYGDTVRFPYSPGSGFYLLSRPEHAEHVLAANQDNYLKAFTYRPLRALIGDGLLTSEGDRWRRHRRLIQPLFSRRHVASFSPAMTDAAQRLTARWDRLPDGTVINVAAQLSAVTLDIVGRALFGSDLSSEADQVGRAMDAGQRVAMLATFVPLRMGSAVNPRTEGGCAERRPHARGDRGPGGPHRVRAPRRRAGRRRPAGRLSGRGSARRAAGGPRPGRLAAHRYRDLRRGGHVHAGRPRDDGEHDVLGPGPAVGVSVGKAAARSRG